MLGSLIFIIIRGTTYVNMCQTELDKYWPVQFYRWQKIKPSHMYFILASQLLSTIFVIGFIHAGGISKDMQVIKISGIGKRSSKLQVRLLHSILHSYADMFSLKDMTGLFSLEWQPILKEEDRILNHREGNRKPLYYLSKQYIAVYR